MSSQAIQTLSIAQDERQHHHELLKQAHYDAQRIERQYVVVELENRWEKALDQIRQCEQTLAASTCDPHPLTEKDKASLLTLGKDIEALWYTQAIPITFKKSIVRTLIEKIITNLE